MGTFKFYINGLCEAVWKEGKPIPNRAKRHCLCAVDLPRAKRGIEVKYYSSGHCRLEYVPAS